MQDVGRLVEVALDLGDAVVGLRVARAPQVLGQRRPVALEARAPARARALELGERLREQREGRARGVLRVARRRGREAVGPHVRVHAVALHLLLVHGDALARRDAPADRLGEELQHLPHGGPLEEAELGQVAALAQDDGVARRGGAQEREVDDLHGVACTTQ